MLVLWLWPGKNTALEPVGVSSQNLARLIEPAIVRVGVHVTGQAIAAPVQFSLTNLSFSVGNGSPQTIPIDEYLTGSGFVVNPEGYIITNSHVVSLQTIKDEFIQNEAQQIFSNETAGLSKAQLQQLFPDDQTDSNFTALLMQYITQHTTFQLQSQVVTFDPSTDQESIEGLMSTGFPVTVISVNDNYDQDGRDVALLKIAQTGLPAIPLGDDSTVTIGDKIYVFGFPSTAEINNSNPLDASLTEGIISAIKDADTRDFNIFQTDAKISEGSSGGPLLNTQGQVTGIITFETGPATQANGDNFAFAVPISLAQQVLDENNIANITGVYYTAFEQGLQLYQANRCQAALQLFNQAEAATSGAFGVDKFVNPYIEACTTLIQEGRSLDTPLEQLGYTLKSVTRGTWFVWLVSALGLLAAVWLFFVLFQKLNREQAEVFALETELVSEQETERRLADWVGFSTLPTPQPQEETHAHARQALNIPHPHLAEFVRQAREYGITDARIEEELKTAGWPENEISNALQ